MKPYKVFILLSLFGLYSCSGFRPFDSKEAVEININNENQVVMGKENWLGPGDCSSRAYLNKTPSGFLFTIEVMDDSIKTGNPESYLNDGVELYFDFRPPRLRQKNSYEKGVFQLIILPEPGKKQLAPMQWFPKSYRTAVPGTRAYTELRDSGYVLQVSIPYSGLSRYHYWPRKQFYLDVAINDADTGARESQLIWKGKRDNWNKPYNFEAVYYEEQNKTKIRPNIILVLTDQQTMNAMGAYGNPYLYTPNMDALARFGVRFTKSYCSSPIGSPSRSSIITGRMPHSTGVNYNEQAIDSSILNMGQYFKEAGYNTYWAGKWYLPESYPQSNSTEVPGFQLISFLERQQISSLGELTDGPVADAVVKFLKGRKREPFLLAISFQNPHDICSMPANISSFPAPVNTHATPPLPGNFEISGNEPEFIRDARVRTSYENEISLTSNFSAADWRNYLYQYYRMVEKADFEIGKIISVLETSGLDENTVIIFTSDHGEGAAAHKWAAKLSLYEESVKVPMIITQFKQDQISKTDNTHLVSGIDILPTMMDYADIEITKSIRGKSLRTIIEKPDTILRNYLVSELAIDPVNPDKTGRMITDGKFKYMIYSYGKNPEQLFNLKTDPGELKNLARNSLYRQEKHKLKLALKQWINDTEDTFTIQF